MAGIKAEMTREIDFSVNTGKLDLAQEWEVFAVGDDNATPNLSGYVDPNTAYLKLPQRGTAHPIFTTALVTGHRLVHIIGAHSVLMTVFYRNYGLYTGGPRAAVSSYGGAGEVPLPVWVRLTATATTGPSFSYYRLSDQFKWQRQHTLRVETRWIGGNQVSAVQRAIARSMGGWYQIDNDFYLLSGQSSVSFDGYTYTRANYVFENWASFPGASANDPLLRNAVAIPALNNLQEWQTAQNTDPTQPPIITVVPHTAFATPGLALPGFP